MTRDTSSIMSRSSSDRFGWTYLYQKIRNGSFSLYRERLVDLVVSPKGHFPPDIPQLDQLGEGAGQMSCGLSQASRDFGEPVAAVGDKRQQGVCLHGAAHVVEQQALRFAVEDAVPVEHQLLDGRLQAGASPGKLPVARHSPPDRILFHRLDTANLEGLLNPERGKGTDGQHLARPAVQGGRRIEDQALHHPLGGTADGQVDTATAVVEELLQQAGQFGGDLHQVGELVQDQAGAGLGACVQGPEQGRPGRVIDLGEARNAPGHFPGKSTELQRSFAQVGGVVDIARAHHLLQKRRLAATTPAEYHDESRLFGSEGPGQSVDFPGSVQKLEAHGTGILCISNIMYEKHNNVPC